MSNPGGTRLGYSAHRVWTQVKDKPNSTAKQIGLAIGISHRSTRNILASLFKEELVIRIQKDELEYRVTKKPFPEINDGRFGAKKKDMDAWASVDPVVQAAFYAMCAVAA